MDCPPPITQECQIIKDGIAITRFPCTVAFKCTGSVASFDELVKSDVSQAKKLLREFAKTD